MIFGYRAQTPIVGLSLRRVCEPGAPRETNSRQELGTATRFFVFKSNRIHQVKQTKPKTIPTTQFFELVCGYAYIYIYQLFRGLVRKPPVATGRVDGNALFHAPPGMCQRCCGETRLPPGSQMGLASAMPSHLPENEVSHPKSDGSW